MTRPELPNLTTARERVDSARSLSIHLEILSLTVDPIDWRAGCVMWPSHLCGVELGSRSCSAG